MANVNKLNLSYSFDESEPDLFKKVVLPDSKIKDLLKISSFDESSDTSKRIYGRSGKELEKIAKKTFETILRGFYDALSPHAAQVILNDGFLAGGCFKSLVLGEAINDYDIFFCNRESADYFSELFRSMEGHTYTGKKFSVTVTAITGNAVTLFVSGFGEYLKIQLITKYFGSPDEVVSRFDFEHCMSYYKWDYGYKLNFDLISRRDLIFNENCSNPLSAIMRLQKFINQGWNVKPSEIIKIGRAIKSQDFSNEKELADSIFGIY